jgi:hypothetical protein
MTTTKINLNDTLEMTKKVQRASDFGLEWFENGYCVQTIYTIFLNDKLIKTYTSTQNDKNIYATVRIGSLCENGVAVVPNQEIIYEIRFHVNSKKKFSSTTRNVMLTAN